MNSPMVLNTINPLLGTEREHQPFGNHVSTAAPSFCGPKNGVEVVIPQRKDFSTPWRTVVNKMPVLEPTKRYSGAI